MRTKSLGGRSFDHLPDVDTVRSHTRGDFVWLGHFVNYAESVLMEITSSVTRRDMTGSRFSSDCRRNSARMSVPRDSTGILKHTTAYLQGYYRFSSVHFRGQYADVSDFENLVQFMEQNLHS